MDRRTPAQQRVPTRGPTPPQAPLPRREPRLRFVSLMPLGEDKPSPLLWDAQVASEVVQSRGGACPRPGVGQLKLTPMGRRLVLVGS